MFKCLFLSFCSVRFLSALRGHSVFSSPPQRPMTFDFDGFSYLNSWERASNFPFECSVLNKGTTSTILQRGPWLGIEPGTSRTRSQPSTTRLSRGGTQKLDARKLQIYAQLRLTHTCKARINLNHLIKYNLTWLFIILCSYFADQFLYCSQIISHLIVIQIQTNCFPFFVFRKGINH